MQKLFYLGALGLILFECANVYFIMPMPGSQELPSLGLAYFLYQWRWVFRGIFGILALAGAAQAWQRKRLWMATTSAAACVVIYMANLQMAADSMFHQPHVLRMVTASENKVPKEKLIIGVAEKGEARAYPIQYIGYHHQVLDTLGSAPLMVTYCTVCRTGRVYRPVVDGQTEQFRLVGMDYFNAMFEDKRTGSWWRQATGEAVAGPLKGQFLPEVAAEQMSLEQWLRLYPDSRIMQADSAFAAEYKQMDSYDTGKGRGPLTGTDTLSWQRKSWVIGVRAAGASKAYDWNQLLQSRIIHDQVGSTPVVLVLASDNKSFFAFERPDPVHFFSLRQDTLYLGERAYSLRGDPLDGQGPSLVKINAVQEFWHSWQTFHPDTEHYQGKKHYPLRSSIPPVYQTR